MTEPSLPWLDPLDIRYTFPAVENALLDPDGLLVAGGDLSAERLIQAYKSGIFPWYSDGQPILWWSPDPRMVLFPGELRISRSLRKRLRRAEFTVTHNQAFERVIENCSKPRPGADETWITDAMKQAYNYLHQLGYAHSVEAWDGDTLVGGLYGVVLGKVYFGESMFSHKTDASKVAFAHLNCWLTQLDFKLIDCQVENPHLVSLGAKNLPRIKFISLLKKYCPDVDEPVVWDISKLTTCSWSNV
ncbi:MAG: leucyl/phenylalanyl-tRNA--protein transferase [Gammaproteobacteria bacterium]